MSNSEVTHEIAQRTRALVEALAHADLRAPSLLPGWSRLTIACHLRYGADALQRMTVDALAGRPTAYYPDGREVQRPGTLEPAADETPEGVVRSLHDASATLDDAWAGVVDWAVAIDEPEGVFDTLATCAILRFLEIEVHGTDLDIGLGPWSDVLVAAALPLRLTRLQRRAPQAPGAWVIGGVRVGDNTEPEVIEATDRDLLALLLGRSPLSPTFSRAFPGP